MIAIRLDPQRLANPDADLRYELPDLITHKSAGRFEDSGFDYGQRNELIVFLACAEPVRELDWLFGLLEEEEICGNRLLDAATVGVAMDESTFEIFHPTAEGATFEISPG